MAEIKWIKKYEKKVRVIPLPPKPKTNADRVRSMTDEQIEKWYWWMHQEMMRYTDSVEFLHQWLKQEEEE